MNQPIFGEGRIQYVLGMRHDNRLEPTEGPALVSVITVPPGLGAPPHSHDRDQEWFYVLEGELTVDLDGASLTLSAGDSCFLPAGKPHAFRNESPADARFIAMVMPGIDAFAFFSEMDAAGRTAPPAPEIVMGSGQRNGLVFA